MITIQATQYRVLLSVNVITQDDTGLHLAVLPLLSFSWLIMVIWKCWLLVNRFRFELATLANDIQEAIFFTGKVLTIGLNSLAYGLGVSL